MFFKHRTRNLVKPVCDLHEQTRPSVRGLVISNYCSYSEGLSAGRILTYPGQTSHKMYTVFNGIVPKMN